MNISKRDIDRLTKATEVAELGEHRVRVGCVAAANGKVVAKGYNTYRNPVHNCPFGEATMHAEVNCIRRIPYLKRPISTLYIARISKANNILDSSPCWRCREFIEIAGIRSVVYWLDDKVIKEKL